jgi:hypothetical protein
LIGAEVAFVFWPISSRRTFGSFGFEVSTRRMPSGVSQYVRSTGCRRCGRAGSCSPCRRARWRALRSSARAASSSRRGRRRCP